MLENVYTVIKAWPILPRQTRKHIFRSVNVHRKVPQNVDRLGWLQLHTILYIFDLDTNTLQCYKIQTHNYEMYCHDVKKCKNVCVIRIRLQGTV